MSTNADRTAFTATKKGEPVSLEMLAEHLRAMALDGAAIGVANADAARLAAEAVALLAIYGIAMPRTR